MAPRIEVSIDGNPADLQKAIGEANKTVNAFGKEFGFAMDIPSSKMELIIKGTKTLVKGTKAVTGAARDAAAEEAIFADAMAAAGAATGDWESITQDAIRAGQKKAFSDTEQMKALASLSTATGDAQSATDLMVASQDIARLAGVSLEQASDAVAKAYAGQDSSLRKMLPGLSKGTTGMDTITAATDLAKGAADNYATSSEAMATKTQIAMGEAAEAVGGPLVGAFDDLRAALQPLIVAFVKLLSQILPPILSLFSRLIGVAAKVAGAISKIVDAVTRLIDKIKDLLSPLTEAVDKLREIDFNPFNKSASAAQSASSVSQFATSAPAVAAPKGGVTINIYGDPSVIEARVTKALRDYARRNGVAAVFAPGRD